MPKSKKELEELTAKFRLTLLESDVGRDVLNTILRDFCHFGQALNPHDPAEIGRYNVGMAILHYCGIFVDNTLEQVVRALASVAPKTTTQEEER